MTADGAASSIMVGVGETYLPAFVLAISASQLASGLVATVPLLAGAVLQLVAPVAIVRLGSYRRWVILCAAVQVGVFFGLAGAALRGMVPAAVVFVLAAVYWAATMATIPAWNAWVATLVPGRVRARYFARRTRLAQLGVLGGVVAGAVLLQWGEVRGGSLTVFAGVFLIAGLARLISTRFLARHREPVPPGDELRHVRPAALFRALHRDADGSALLYLLAAQTAVQLAGPFFTPYMLWHLEFTYIEYMVLISAAFLTKVACLPALGRLVDRIGVDRLLWLGGVAIVPVPALWYFSSNLYFLLAAQILSGAAWAAYELALLLLFVDAIPRERRVSVLTVFNLANAVAIVGGSLLGGTLLGLMGVTRNAYLTLFVLSALARAAALLLLQPAPATRPQSATVAAVPVSVQPSLGLVRRAVLTAPPLAAEQVETTSQAIELPAVIPAGNLMEMGVREAVAGGAPLSGASAPANGDGEEFEPAMPAAAVAELADSVAAEYTLENSP